MSRAQCLVVRDNLILMMQHREASHEYWCLPGGRIDEGESPEFAALRELREECRVEGRIIRRLSRVEFAPDDYYVTYLIDIGAQTPTLGHDPENPADQQILLALAWKSLRDLTETDRVYLWTSGLLTLPEFAAEVLSWPREVCVPK